MRGDRGRTSLLASGGTFHPSQQDNLKGREPKTHSQSVLLKLSEVSKDCLSLNFHKDRFNGNGKTMPVCRVCIFTPGKPRRWIRPRNALFLSLFSKYNTHPEGYNFSVKFTTLSSLDSFLVIHLSQ